MRCVLAAYEETQALQVSPNLLRAAIKRQQAGKYKAKVAGQKRARDHKAANPMPVSELADVFR